MKIQPAKQFRGTIRVPGDKSISHRALIFSALASGVSDVSGLSEGQDVQSTTKCLKALGIDFKNEFDRTLVYGKGLQGLMAPVGNLDCGNSGTTMRLLMGVLAGQNFESTLVGDDSLNARPMDRVAEPLRAMGAKIELTNGKFAPVRISPSGGLVGQKHKLTIPSAQIKSSILLAGLYAEGATEISGRIDGRDHTERLFPEFGIAVRKSSGVLTLTPELDRSDLLEPSVIQVPGDLSSAAFWIAGATLIRNSKLTLQNVSLNPTRMGFLNVLERMGAKIQIKIVNPHGEPFGDIQIEYAPLNGTTISEKEVPSLIDELPLIAVLASFAEGVTEVRGAKELRVKETDRIGAVVKNFRALGVRIEEFEDGFKIQGPQTITFGAAQSFHDHRIAMAFSIAAMATKGGVIGDSDCVAISYPTFFSDLERLANG
jgi:3-phosphoshikimate 1-carboxyvinyltransferase